ncbi:MAG: hypothetical protein JXA66_09245 [Oligoflexia bacterium]|nr:hypothetical protein [Oligoflexia bacterium]
MRLSISNIEQKSGTWLLYIILAGLTARVLCSYFVYGFIGFDEYFNGIEPAGYKLFVDRSYHFLKTERTPLLFYTDYLMFYLFHELVGITSPVNIIRFSMMLFGFFSIISVVAAYKTSLTLGENKKISLAVAAVVSLYFIMPYMHTRLMIESISSIFVVAGFYYFAKARMGIKVSVNMFLSSVLMGVACMYRFQDGILLVALFIIAVYYGKRKGFVFFAAGGLTALLLQIALDYFTFGGFLTSLTGYIIHQYRTIGVYDKQYWFNFILLFVALGLPPAFLVTIPAAVKGGMKHAFMGLPFLMFVLLHSFSPHKEDRFMFPVIPVFLMLMVFGLNDICAYCKKKSFSGLYKFSVGCFICLNIILLLPSISSPTVANIIEPAVYAVSQPDYKGYVSDSPVIPKFFLKFKGKIKQIKKLKWKKYLCSRAARSVNYVHSIYPPEKTGITEVPALCNVRIQYIGNFKSGYIDRFFAFVNPEHNYRRANGYLFKIIH